MDTLYSFIVFKAADIKDLHVEETTPAVSDAAVVPSRRRRQQQHGTRAPPRRRHVPSREPALPCAPPPRRASRR